MRQRSPACDAATEAAATPIAEPTKATQEAAEAKLAAILAKQEEERFDWIADDSVIVEKQLPIAIYINKRDHIVIRQEADWGEDEDSVVIVAPANIREFISKLCDVAGIPSVGRP